MTTTKPSAPGGAASPPLSRLLDATATALQAIRAGQSGTAALDASDAALRPAVQALLFQVLRNLGRAQALRRQLAPRNPPARVDALGALCVHLQRGDLPWRAQRGSPFQQVRGLAARGGAGVQQAQWLAGIQPGQQQRRRHLRGPVLHRNHAIGKAG